MVAWSQSGDQTLNGTLFTIVAGETFVGTPGPDSFTGTIADDTMYGLGGNDHLDGRR